MNRSTMAMVWALAFIVIVGCAKSSGEMVQSGGVPDDSDDAGAEGGAGRADVTPDGLGFGGGAGEDAGGGMDAAAEGSAGVEAGEDAGADSSSADAGGVGGADASVDQDSGGGDAAALEPPYFITGLFDTMITLGSFTLQSDAPPGSTNVYLARVDDGTVTWAVAVRSTLDLWLGNISAALTSAPAQLPKEGAVYLAVFAVSPQQSVLSFDSTSGSNRTHTTTQYPPAREAFVVRYDLSGTPTWVSRIGFGSPHGAEQEGFIPHSVEQHDQVVTVVGAKSWGPPIADVVGVFGDDGSGSGLIYTTAGDKGYTWSVQLAATTGQPIAGSLGIVQSDVQSGWIEANSRTRTFHAPNGDFVLAGQNYLTTVLRYFVNYNTASPLEISPGPLLEDGWIAKIRPSEGYRALWAYRIGSPLVDDVDNVGGVTVLASGDIVVSGSTEGDSVELHHAGGFKLLSGGTPGTNGWIARYVSDGTAVSWAKLVMGGGVGSPLVDEPAGAYYVGGYANGAVTLGSGEPNEATFDLGSGWGGYVARFDVSSGSFQWAQPVTSSDRVYAVMIAREGTQELVAYVAWAEDVTFDPGGPAELALSAVGERVYGFARYTTSGAFVSFIEITRKPKTMYRDFVQAAQAR